MVRGTEVGAESRSVGLGLYIVAEIARAHGGQAELASSSEAGTEFLVRFPRQPPD
jgi:sigma-B regulation protein RsbU (phosphoserine phosphatase)